MDFIRLRDRKSLRRLQVACGRKVEVIFVLVDFEISRTGVGCGGADQDGMKFQDASKTMYLLTPSGAIVQAFANDREPTAQS